MSMTEKKSPLGALSAQVRRMCWRQKNELWPFCHDEVHWKVKQESTNQRLILVWYPTVNQTKYWIVLVWSNHWRIRFTIISPHLTLAGAGALAPFRSVLGLKFIFFSIIIMFGELSVPHSLPNMCVCVSLFLWNLWGCLPQISRHFWRQWGRTVADLSQPFWPKHEARQESKEGNLSRWKPLIDLYLVRWYTCTTDYHWNEIKVQG